MCLQGISLVSSSMFFVQYIFYSCYWFCNRREEENVGGTGGGDEKEGGCCVGRIENVSVLFLYPLQPRTKFPRVN